MRMRVGRLRVRWVRFEPWCPVCGAYIGLPYANVLAHQIRRLLRMRAPFGLCDACRTPLDDPARRPML